MTAGAIWIAAWYELDQAIEVGLEDEFWFWVAEDRSSGPPELLFYNTLSRPSGLKVFAAHGQIIRILHPQLGGVRFIDTRGLDYTFHLMDGTSFSVNAEERPPYNSVNSLDGAKEWTFEVEFASLGPLNEVDLEGRM